MIREKQSVFLEALKGKRGQDQQRIAEVVLDLGTTLLKKNQDYGGSVWKRPVLAPNLDNGTAILVRASDKISRLNNLLDNPDKVEVKDESLTDTLKDLAAYFILYLARPEEDHER